MTSGRIKVGDKTSTILIASKNKDLWLSVI